MGDSMSLPILLYISLVPFETFNRSPNVSPIFHMRILPIYTKECILSILGDQFASIYERNPHQLPKFRYQDYRTFSSGFYGLNQMRCRFFVGDKVTAEPNRRHSYFTGSRHNGHWNRRITKPNFRPQIHRGCSLLTKKYWPLGQKSHHRGHCSLNNLPRCRIRGVNEIDPRVSACQVSPLQGLPLTRGRRISKCSSVRSSRTESSTDLSFRW